MQRGIDRHLPSDAVSASDAEAGREYGQGRIVGLHPGMAHSIDQDVQNLVDVQSVGAAIQNMLLTARAGLGFALNL